MLVTVEGRLDSFTAENFRKEIVAEVGADERIIVMDLAAVNFVSSAGPSGHYC